MVSRQPEPLTIATEWIRGYAQTCVPSELSFEFSEADLLAKDLSLLDVLDLFREGKVVYADKLDGPGGYWVIEGEDAEGRTLSAEIVVISESLTVRLLSIDLVAKEDTHDAA